MVKTKRTYKDSLFRKAFEKREHLLALYNAMNGSSYEDVGLLEIRTLEDVIYVGVKNDVAFLLDDVLNLFEHQSTFNPNMPIRALSYFASLYQAYIDEYRINVYSSKQQHLPFPQYIVFYNGERSEPDRRELRLSDAFIRGGHISPDIPPGIEIRAVMLNINWGHNQELLDACERLREYSLCIATIRGYKSGLVNAEASITAAVDECIAKGYLADILSKNRSEVISLFLTEYDAKKHMELERRDAREEGRMEGAYEKLVVLVCRQLRAGKTAAEIAELFGEDEDVIAAICTAAAPFAPEYDAKQVYDAAAGRTEKG